MLLLYLIACRYILQHFIDRGEFSRHHWIPRKARRASPPTHGHPSCCERCRTTSTTIDRSTVTQHDGDDDAQDNQSTNVFWSQSQWWRCPLHRLWKVSRMRLRLALATGIRFLSTASGIMPILPNRPLARVELQQNRRYQLSRLQTRMLRRIVGLASMPCCERCQDRSCRCAAYLPEGMSLVDIGDTCGSPMGLAKYFGRPTLR
jgi:hypothetical protein